MDVYMKFGLHIDVHWTSKGRLMPTEKYELENNPFSQNRWCTSFACCLSVKYEQEPILQRR